MNETFGIGRAIDEMRAGQKVVRDGWNGKSQWCELQIPDANSKMTKPYVFITTAEGNRIPWLCSQSDLLATDWHIKI